MVGGQRQSGTKLSRRHRRPAPHFFLSWTLGVSFLEVTEKKVSDSKAYQCYHRSEFSSKASAGLLRRK